MGRFSEQHRQPGRIGGAPAHTGPKAAPDQAAVLRLQQGAGNAAVAALARKAAEAAPTAAPAKKGPDPDAASVGAFIEQLDELMVNARREPSPDQALAKAAELADTPVPSCEDKKLQAAVQALVDEIAVAVEGVLERGGELVVPISDEHRRADKENRKLEKKRASTIGHMKWLKGQIKHIKGPLGDYYKKRLRQKGDKMGDYTMQATKTTFKLSQAASARTDTIQGTAWDMVSGIKARMKAILTIVGDKSVLSMKEGTDIAESMQMIATDYAKQLNDEAGNVL